MHCTAVIDCYDDSWAASAAMGHLLLTAAPGAAQSQSLVLLKSCPKVARGGGAVCWDDGGSGVPDRLLPPQGPASQHTACLVCWRCAHLLCRGAAPQPPGPGHKHILHTLKLKAHELSGRCLLCCSLLATAGCVWLVGQSGPLACCYAMQGPACVLVCCTTRSVQRQCTTSPAFLSLSFSPRSLPTLQNQCTRRDPAIATLAAAKAPQHKHSDEVMDFAEL
jgi:hypothetical protein